MGSGIAQKALAALQDFAYKRYAGGAKVDCDIEIAVGPGVAPRNRSENDDKARLAGYAAGGGERGLEGRVEHVGSMTALVGEALVPRIAEKKRSRSR